MIVPQGAGKIRAAAGRIVRIYSFENNHRIFKIGN
jgi:hypothetical protein